MPAEGGVSALLPRPRGRGPDTISQLPTMLSHLLVLMSEVQNSHSEHETGGTKCVIVSQLPAQRLLWAAAGKAGETPGWNATSATCW